MSSLQVVNSKAENAKKMSAININCNAAQGLQQVLVSNLGPAGSYKMLVGGAGQIKITKDGNVLLHQMQIQHPTAAMIGRAATAQDDIGKYIESLISIFDLNFFKASRNFKVIFNKILIVGDGTTSNVLFIGELIKICKRHIQENVHPRHLVEGIEKAQTELLGFLKKLKVQAQPSKDMLLDVARTSLMTKVPSPIANNLIEKIVDAVLTVRREQKKEIDLHMVELMIMRHKLSTQSKLIRGLVLDHGARHESMPKSLENCYILTLNVSLEYERTQVNAQFFWKDAANREELVKSERAFTDQKVQKIIDLKRKVCQGTEHNLVVINQKGIDPLALDMLAKENIIGIRRAKRRNMERLTLACGGNALNSVEEMSKDDLGYAKSVYEHVLGDDKFTFVQGCANPFSCTLLIKGPNQHTIAQVKDAIHDGLRAVKNAIDDGGYVYGAGCFQLKCYQHLKQFQKQVSGKRRLGVGAFADALLVIPKTLALNAGYDAQDVTLNLIEKQQKDEKKHYGLDLSKGQARLMDIGEQILDNYCVKQQFLAIAPLLAQQLMLVDEVMRAGKQMGRQ